MRKIGLLFFTFLIFFEGYSQTNGSFFMFTAGPQNPNISTSGSFVNFTNVTGTASASQNISVSGNNLTADVVATAPAGFEISLDNSSFGPTKTFTHSGTLLSGQPLPLYCRVAAATASGSPSGNISLTSTGATTVNVAVTATVSSGSSNKVIQVQLWDGTTTGSKIKQPSWQTWTPPDIAFGATTTSTAFNDSNGVATTVTATLSIGQADNTANGFYTTNGSGYAAATTSGFPDTVFQTPYLFTGGATTASDTLRFNGLPTSTSNFTIELISSRSTGTPRPQTFTINSTTIPATGTFDAMNNLNNLSGGHVPLFWTNISRDGGNHITVVINYTNSFCFINAFRITWTP